MGMVLLSLGVSGCGQKIDDYSGTWMGIDQRPNGGSKIYEYNIAMNNDEVTYTIRVTQYDYKKSFNSRSAQWSNTEPHYVSGYLDTRGHLVSSIGTFVAEPKNFRLIYGNINLVRKAKNVELKLKYVLRNEIEKRYPQIEIID